MPPDLNSLSFYNVPEINQNCKYHGSHLTSQLPPPIMPHETLAKVEAPLAIPTSNDYPM